MLAYLAAALSLLVVSATAIAQGKPTAPQHAPSLLAKSTRILSVPFDQSAFSQSSEAVAYPWLSDHELLHYRKNGRLFRYNLNTKTDQPLPALTTQVASSHAYERFLIVSPTGASVLWGESASNPFFAADAAGVHRFQWPGNGGLSGPYWCADGHHWVEMQFSGIGSSLSPKVEFTRALLHDAEAPNATPPLPAIPNNMQGMDILGVIGSDQIIARVPDVVKFVPSKEAPTVTKDGSYSMAFTDLRTPSVVQQISVWKLGQATPLHRWAIHLPEVPSEVVVSPHGDQVAWLLSPKQPKTLPTALREATVSLWVSRLDGSGMHLIGTVTQRLAPFNTKRLEQILSTGRNLDAATQKQLSALSMPLQVQWLPSGGAVSFQYEGAIWVVPVE